MEGLAESSLNRAPTGARKAGRIMRRFVMVWGLVVLLLGTARAGQFECTRCLPDATKLHQAGLVRCGECTASIAVGGLAATLACALCADDGSSVTCDRCQ